MVVAKIQPSEPARAVEPRPRPSAFLHVYTLAAGVLAISCCVDFVAARRNKIATRAGPCGARSCVRRPCGARSCVRLRWVRMGLCCVRVFCKLLWRNGISQRRLAGGPGFESRWGFLFLFSWFSVCRVFRVLRFCPLFRVFRFCRVFRVLSSSFFFLRFPSPSLSVCVLRFGRHQKKKIFFFLLVPCRQHNLFKF